MFRTGSRVGAYEVEAELGRGGMAAVYRVRHAKLGSLHALKVLLPQIAQNEEIRLRFLNEGRIQAQLRHSAIVPVTDLLEEGGAVGLVMDFVEGQSLDELLRTQSPLSSELVRELFLQVLRGLAYVHERGVVHRDLKPSNVMVDFPAGRPRARLVDFGIAKLDTPDAPSITRTGMTLGTLRYMSPEQIRGEKVDGRSDLFSLGVMLYEVLTGRFPFEGDSAWSLQMAVVEGRLIAPEPLRPDLAGPLLDLVRRVLSVRPEDRFASADAFAEALEGATRLPGATPWTPPATPPSMPASSAAPTIPARPAVREAAEDVEALAFPHRTSPVRWVAAGLFAVAVSVALWFIVRPAPPPSRPRGPARAEVHEVVRETMRVEKKSGLAFVRLPGGEFRIGCHPSDPHCSKDEPPSRFETVDGFWFGVTEVTVAAWDKCVSAGVCKATARTVVNAEGETCNPGDRTKKDHPVNCLTWEESKTFCAWLGGRLPTSTEWEFAARSGGGYAFWPWGREEATKELARYAVRDDAKERTAPVGTHSKGETRWGLQDMAGNVWEATSTLFDPSKGTYEAKGGSFNSEATALRASNRFEVDPLVRSDSVGFRCALDKGPEL